MGRACIAAWLLAGCQADVWSGEVPVPDRVMFESEVYPVLLRDCGFNACHGDPLRFLLVLGPGRARADATLDPDMPATPVELEVTYQRARSLLIADGPVTTSPLLTKPLQERAGGVSHKGVDDLGRNVYASTLAPGYATLVRWAQTMTPPSIGGAGAPPAAGTSGSGL